MSVGTHTHTQPNYSYFSLHTPLYAPHERYPFAFATSADPACYPAAADTAHSGSETVVLVAAGAPRPPSSVAAPSGATALSVPSGQTVRLAVRRQRTDTERVHSALSGRVGRARAPPARPRSLFGVS